MHRGLLTVFVGVRVSSLLLTRLAAFRYSTGMSPCCDGEGQESADRHRLRQSLAGVPPRRTAGGPTPSRGKSTRRQRRWPPPRPRLPVSELRRVGCLGARQRRRGPSPPHCPERPRWPRQPAAPGPQPRGCAQGRGHGPSSPTRSQRGRRLPAPPRKQLRDRVDVAAVAVPV